MALAWADRLPLGPGAPALEVGCGAGVLSVALAQRGLSVQALDPAPAMAALARRRAAEAGVDSQMTVCLGDAHALPFADASFELVMSLGVLPWLHSPARAVAEMARTLKPGGWLIASFDNRASLVHFLDPLRNPALAPFKRLVKRALGRAAVGAVQPPRADRQRDADRMLGQAGLSRVDDATCGFGPLTVCWRPVLSGGAGVAVERRLQALADRGIPGIRSVGWHYLVLARKTESYEADQERIVWLSDRHTRK
jgi:ubiquinone/menaquinone biosynthesis C-methylase UbiE